MRRRHTGGDATGVGADDARIAPAVAAARRDAGIHHAGLYAEASAASVTLGGASYAFALPRERRVVVVDVTTGTQSHDSSLAALGPAIAAGDDLAPSADDQIIALADGTVAIASSIGHVVIVDLDGEHIATGWTAPSCPAAAAP